MNITVYGRPITQGSKVRTRWAMRDANGATLAPWRDNVRAAAVNLDDPFGESPVIVLITFTFARPRGHFGTGRNAGTLNRSALPYPSSHAIGDIDKLARAILDALTDAGVWNDDSQVVTLNTCKVFVGEYNALDRPGAVISVDAA